MSFLRLDFYRKQSAPNRNRFFSGFSLLIGISFFSLTVSKITAHAEIALYHQHVDSCFECITEECQYPHIRTTEVLEMVRYCPVCNSSVSHNYYVAWEYCSFLKDKKEKGGYFTCKQCGNKSYEYGLFHSEWKHQITIKNKLCPFDDTLPCVRFSLIRDNGDWTHVPVTVSWKTETLQEGFSWEGSKFYILDGDLNQYEQKISIQKNQTITGKVITADGREYTEVISIDNIDTVPPTCEILLSNQNWITGEQKITITAGDEGSGLPDQPYSFDGGQTWGGNSEVIIQTTSVIEIAVKDRAGNVVKRTLNLIKNDKKGQQDIQQETTSIPEEQSDNAEEKNLNNTEDDFSKEVSVTNHSVDKTLKREEKKVEEETGSEIIISKKLWNIRMTDTLVRNRNNSYQEGMQREEELYGAGEINSGSEGESEEIKGSNQIQEGAEEYDITEEVAVVEKEYELDLQYMSPDTLDGKEAIEGVSKNRWYQVLKGIFFFMITFIFAFWGIFQIRRSKI